MITVVDYGMANLGSILNMLRKIGVEPAVASTPQAVRGADRLILPGVGAFDHGMKALHERGLVEPLREAVLARRAPMLGICLGMQLLARSSEEGGLAGLDLIPARCLRLRFGPEVRALKVPQMGWNEIRARRPSALLEGLGAGSRFYFVHAYHVACDEDDDVLATTWYGQDFTSIVARGNLFGVQFHPEKSHRFGLMLLKNFVELT